MLDMRRLRVSRRLLQRAAMMAAGSRGDEEDCRWPPGGEERNVVDEGTGAG